MESPSTDPLRRDYCYMIRTKFQYVAFIHSFIICRLIPLSVQRMLCFTHNTTLSPSHRSECGCLDNDTETNHREMDDTAYAYNDGLLQIAEAWQAKNLSDFYVSAIPFLRAWFALCLSCVPHSLS